LIRFNTANMERNLREYLRIKDAAAVLGISEGTLRNWSQQGKITVHRHPINGYRLYKREDLQGLLLAVRRSATHERRE
jgi:excisionase family DNA binding protein